MGNTTIREYDWEQLVIAAEGETFFDPATAYIFQAGRKFKDKGLDSAIFTQMVTDPAFTEDGFDWTTKSNLAGFNTGQIYNISSGSGFCWQTPSTTLIAGVEYIVTMDIAKLDSGSIHPVVGTGVVNKVYVAGIHTQRHTPQQSGVVGLSFADQTSPSDAIANSITIRRA